MRLTSFSERVLPVHAADRPRLETAPPLTRSEAVDECGVLSEVGVGGVHLDHLEAGLLLLPHADDAVQRLQELRPAVVIVQHAHLARKRCPLETRELSSQTLVCGACA